MVTAEIAKPRQLKLSRPQTQVFRSRAAITLNLAGQGSGKSQMVGIMTGLYVSNFPFLKGFIGANTHNQLEQSTMTKAFEVWRNFFGITEYTKQNPYGHYVVNKRPPAHFKIREQFPGYEGIISFWNGHVIFMGSLENYLVHDGKEFAYAHLDETKDTREVAVKSVILARLRQRGLYVNQAGQLIYEPEPERATVLIGVKSFTPCWIHTSPAIAGNDWLVSMFGLEPYAAEIKARITGTLPDGRPDFYMHDDGDYRVVVYSTFHNAENLTDTYIPSRLRTLAENEVLKLVYGYPFSKTGSEYFPYFNRLKHVAPTPYVPGLVVHGTWDFNVLPYMTHICFQVERTTWYADPVTNVWHREFAPGRILKNGMRVRAYKEYCLKNPNNSVEGCFNAFSEDHPKLVGAYTYYGDASGKNRIPGFGNITNFGTIASLFSRFMHNDSDKVPRKNPPILTRRDLVNRLLEGKLPGVELIIDPECKQLIRDLESCKTGPNGKLKEYDEDPESKAKFEKIGHTSDALEYFLFQLLYAYVNLN